MEYEYTFCPKVHLGRSAVLVGALTVTGVLLGAASVEKTVFSPYFAVASSVLLFLAVLLSIRFIGTRYVYKITVNSFGEGELTVSELRGFFGKAGDVKSQRTVCRVDISDVKESVVLERSEKGRASMKNEKKRIRRERATVYNYSADVFADKYALLRIENADEVAYLKLSPDEEMLKIIAK